MIMYITVTKMYCCIPGMSSSEEMFSYKYKNVQRKLKDSRWQEQNQKRKKKKLFAAPNWWSGVDECLATTRDRSNMGKHICAQNEEEKKRRRGG